MELAIPTPAPPPDPRPAWPRWLRWLARQRRVLFAVLGAAAPILCRYIPEAIPQQLCQAVVAVLFPLS